MKYYYRAYGLAVSSNRPLPWFQRARQRKRPDVRARVGELPPGLRPKQVMAGEALYVCPDQGPQGGPWLKIWSDPTTGYFLFRWSDETLFAVEARGREIWASWPASLKEDEVIPVYLTGNMMSFILRLRGYACLHASAVVVDGRALLIGGPSGSGKSTLAASFARAGYAVLSDDVAALKCRRDSVMVYPSFPRIGLWPPSAEGLFGPDHGLARLWPNEEKRFMRLDADSIRFPTRAVPLGAVYTLGDKLPAGEKVRIEPAVGPQAILALVASTFGVLLRDSRARAAEFRLKARAAEQPVRYLHRPMDFSRLGELCDSIVRDFRSFQKRGARLPEPIAFAKVQRSRAALR